MVGTLFSLVLPTLPFQRRMSICPFPPASFPAMGLGSNLYDPCHGGNFHLKVRGSKSSGYASNHIATILGAGVIS